MSTKASAQPHGPPCTCPKVKKNAQTHRDGIQYFSATHSVLNVKLDVSSVTNIAVSKQVWTGWPDNVNDDLSLAQLGIPTEHNLYVNRKENVSHSCHSRINNQLTCSL